MPLAKAATFLAQGGACSAWRNGDEGFLTKRGERKVRDWSRHHSQEEESEADRPPGEIGAESDSEAGSESDDAPEDDRPPDRASAPRRAPTRVPERTRGSTTFRLSSSKSGGPLQVDVGDVIELQATRAGGRLSVVVDEVFAGQEGLFNHITQPRALHGGRDRRRSKAMYTAYVVGRAEPMVD